MSDDNDLDKEMIGWLRSQDMEVTAAYFRLRCCQNALRIGSTRAILFGRLMCSSMRWNSATSGLTASIRQRPAGLRIILRMLKLYIYGYLNRVQSSRRSVRLAATWK